MADEPGASDVWKVGTSYEQYVGRWSRHVAERFVDWIEADDGLAWVDIGCGTGALTDVVLQKVAPQAVTGVDLSEGFLSLARRQVTDVRATFSEGNAQNLSFDDDAFDGAVSGLVINFVPDPAKAVGEMRRVVRPGGHVAFYVWDYAEGCRFIRDFWDAAVALDPSAEKMHEGRRFPLCAPDALKAVAEHVGLRLVAVDGIVIPTEFKDFDDYWKPFLGGQGPAPAYCMGLNQSQRDALKHRLQEKLPVSSDGRIRLTARAWAVRATV